MVVSLDPPYFFQLCRFTYYHATSGQSPELTVSQRLFTTFGPPSGLLIPTADSDHTINDKNLLLGVITRIIQIVVANGLPTTEGKLEVWIHPLIIGA